MRISRAIVSPTGCLLFLLCLAGCQRPEKPADPIPPFTKVDEFVGGWRFCNDYDTDPSQADKKYKGKILSVSHDTWSLPWSRCVVQEDTGRKYLSIRYTPAGSSAYREMARCYLYRPENPIVEDEGQGDSFGVRGVCKGIRDGVIILENCNIFIYADILGTNW